MSFEEKCSLPPILCITYIIKDHELSDISSSISPRNDNGNVASPGTTPVPTLPPVKRKDPGKALNVAGIILVFIPLMTLIAFFVSMAGVRKSQKAGYHGTLGVVAATLSATHIFTTCAVIMAGVVTYNFVSPQLADLPATVSQVIQLNELSGGQLIPADLVEQGTNLLNMTGNGSASNDGITVDGQILDVPVDLKNVNVEELLQQVDMEDVCAALGSGPHDISGTPITCP